MTDLDIFREAVTHEENSAAFKNWAAANCGASRGGTVTNPTLDSDLAKWNAYKQAVLAGQNLTPPSMSTEHGVFLVDTARMAAPDVSPPPPPPPPSPPPATTLSRFGVANGWHFLFRSASEQDFEAGRCRDVGAGMMRVDGTKLDGCQKIRNFGMRPVCLIGSNPSYPWSKSPSQYGTDCGNAASALKGVCNVFELLNEPDLHGWHADTYFPYLKAGSEAIRMANPDAIVLHAGLFKGTGGSFLMDWMERIYQLGGKDLFDVANFHPYDDPMDHGSWSNWDMIFGSGGRGFYDTRNVKTVMTKYGDGSKPIVSTESGGPTPKYSLAKQAQIVHNALVDSRLASCFIFSMLDDDVAGFGMLDGSRNPRPSYNAYKTVATGAVTARKFDQKVEEPALSDEEHEKIHAELIAAKRKNAQEDQ